MPEREDPTLIRRYLLGDLPPETAAPLDERLLSDEDFYEQVLLEEDGLAEDHVRGTVPASDRPRVDAFLATPERQRNVALTRALSERFASQTTAAALTDRAPAATVRRAPAWATWAAAASLLVSTGTAVYFVTETRRLQRELSATSERITPVDSAPAQPPLSVLLTATAATRMPGAGPATIVVPADTAAVQLQFQLPGNVTTRSYTIEIRRAGRGQVWGTGDSGIATQQPQTVAVSVPAVALAPDDYVALVSSPESGTVHEYQFRVVRP